MEAARVVFVHLGLPLKTSAIPLRFGFKCFSLRFTVQGRSSLMKTGRSCLERPRFDDCLQNALAVAASKGHPSATTMATT